MKLISKIKVSNFQIFILENENILYISIGTLDSDIDRYKKDNKIVLNSESERTQIDSATTSKPVFETLKMSAQTSGNQSVFFLNYTILGQFLIYFKNIH